jgi:hypothetical protein
MEIPKTFFTSESFESLASCSAIVFVVSNACQRALNFNPKWLGLFLAEATAFYGAYASQNLIGLGGCVIAVLNGCLIYSTAVGGTNLAASTGTGGQPKGLPSAKRSFFTPWF